MTMVLTDTFQTVARDHGGRKNQIEVTITCPMSTERLAMNIPRVVCDKAGWVIDRATFVRMSASNREFVLLQVNANANDAIRLTYSKKGGKLATRVLSLSRLTDAVCIEPGERFVIPVTIEGNVVTGEWPGELRDRMADKLYAESS